jgi:hypothetical protein
LFDSVAQGLRWYQGPAQSQLHHRLRMLGVPDVRNLTHAGVRSMVYMFLLAPPTDPESHEWLHTWATLHSALPAEEMAFAHGLVPAPSYSTRVRVQVFERCMSPTTWGDETALCLLERLLGIAFVLVTSPTARPQPWRGVDHGPGFVPMFYIVLQFHATHYALVTRGTQSGFSATELGLPTGPLPTSLSVSKVVPTLRAHIAGLRFAKEVAEASTTTNTTTVTSAGQPPPGPSRGGSGSTRTVYTRRPMPP